jgi:hypothetical protein
MRSSHAIARLGGEHPVHRHNLRIALGIGILVVAGRTLVPLPVQNGVGKEEAAKARGSGHRDDYLTVGTGEVLPYGSGRHPDVDQGDQVPTAKGSS